MKNVLLVEDDFVFQFLGQKLLTLVGLPPSDVQTALNGLQALEVFNNLSNANPADARDYRAPDVVLLDLRMPVLDGFGFLEGFSKLDFPGKENVRIVVVTSSINPEDILRTQQYGVADYIVKPLTEEKVRQALQFLD